MDSKTINLNQSQTEYENLDNNSVKIPIDSIFAERNCYLNEFTLFLAHFNAIPNYISEENINCKKATQWFLENFRDEIIDFHFSKRYFNQNKKAEYDDIFYILKNNLIVFFDTRKSTVVCLFRKTGISIIEGVKKIKERKVKSKPEISLLVNTRSGLDTQSLEITKPRLSIDDNYNDDFKKIHETI